MATLILLRHGKSIWNRQNRFTGWVDVSLSRVGIAEAERAAVLLGEERLERRVHFRAPARPGHGLRDPQA